MQSSTVSRHRSSDLRAVALPAEHGGWGFLLEPILLGLLVAPTLAGFCLGIATAAAFLLRQPVKYVLLDRRRGLRNRRTELAMRVGAVYGAVALIGFSAAVWIAGVHLVGPLLAATPFAIVFLYFDLTRPGRTLQAELMAPVALAAVASSMAIAAGWLAPFAVTLWVLLAARAVPSVLYVRARLRLDRERPVSIAVPLVAHAAALLVVGWLVARGWSPLLALLPFVLLLIRAGLFLAPNRPRWPIKTIGFIELGAGLLTVMAIALGYWLSGSIAIAG